MVEEEKLASKVLAFNAEKQVTEQRSVHGIPRKHVTIVDNQDTS